MLDSPQVAVKSSPNCLKTVQQEVAEPKPDEEALRESEEQLHSIARNVPGMVFQFFVRKNGEVGFNYISDHPLIRLGFDNTALEGAFDRFVAAVAPEDRERFLASIRAAVESVCPWKFEGKILQPTGGEVYFNGVAQPRRLHDELVFDGLILDVTERQRAEIALKESETAFRSLFEAGPAAAALLVDRKFQRVNSLMCKNTGYSDTELLGQSTRIHYADDAEFDRVSRELYDAVERDGVGMVQARHRRKNGELYDVLLCARRLDPKNPAKGMVVTVLDITERKQAEAALHASERKLANIFQFSPELIGVSTAEEGRYWEVNDAFTRVLGYTREEVLGHTSQELGIWFSHADRERMVNLVKERGTVNNLEVQIRKKSGEKMDALLSTTSISIEGQPCMIVMATDITEHKQAEAALRESQASLETAQAIARIGSWDFYPPTQPGKWSKEMYRLFNLDPASGVPHPTEFLKMVHPEDRENFHTAFLRALGADKPSRHEFRTNPADGPIRYLANILHPIKQSHGEGPCMTGTIQDITERKRTEERLREQAALLDAATDAIYVRTLDHNVTYWNDSAERLFEWTRTEAPGRKITAFENVGREAFETAHAALLQLGSWSGELTRTNKAGKKLILFCRWTLLRDERGQPKAVLAINTDITEQRQLEANFLRAQRMEGLGALAGGIAHDLNNILAPILMAAPLLSAMTPDRESREILNTMESCAQRGAEIIRQLLTFARGSPGARLPLPVCHLLRDMEKIIRETFPRNIKTSLAAPQDLWPVMGDATQLHQALMNLCVNARDAMPDGGKLTLVAENLTLDEPFASMLPGAKPGLYVRVKVTDTGTGIPPEHLDRIFDPFFTTKEIGKGTGLGLPTVLGIVRGHGGCLRVKSEMGQGTTFELYLPASPEAKAATPPPRETLPPRAGGELILVVDDEPSVCALVQRALEEHDYKVITAAEGAEAMNLFARHKAEVRAVLTDMMMPGMDGPSLVRALRQQEPQLPILGMTGMGEKADVKGLAALDLVTLLTKPFKVAVVLGALQQALAAPAKASHNSPADPSL